MADWDIPDFAGNGGGGSSWVQPDFAGTAATDTVNSGGGFTGIAPVTPADAEIWRQIRQSDSNHVDDSSKNDLASYIRDTALAVGTSLFTAGTQALSAKIAKAVGAGSNPVQQGPTGRTIMVGGIPVTLTATQAAGLAAGQGLKLTKNQRLSLASKGVNVSRTILNAGSGNAAADAGGSPNTLYFILAGGVLLLLFMKK